MATEAPVSLEALAQRISDLEREVALLRKREQEPNSKGWVSRMMGTFKDDPEFAEILRLGREYRAAQRDETS